MSDGRLDGREDGREEGERLKRTGDGAELELGGPVGTRERVGFWDGPLDGCKNTEGGLLIAGEDGAVLSDGRLLGWKDVEGAALELGPSVGPVEGCFEGVWLNPLTDGARLVPDADEMEGAKLGAEESVGSCTCDGDVDGC